LIFDNYTAAAKPSDASPAISYSRGAPAEDFLNDTSGADSFEEVIELRQQLQAMKKQAVIIMDQSRKSLEREQAALQRAQEALKLEEAATTEALRAASREEYMLDLLTDASLDMAGECYLLAFLCTIHMFLFHASLSPFIIIRLLCGHCCRGSAC
jgi:hypothetical protein